MRILLVEDDRQLRSSIARGLQEASYIVQATGRAEQALTLAASATFDVIVLDLMLPDMSGLDVCRALRSSGSRVPILILTALDAIEQRISGLDAGADDYLTKPFDFGELLARLRALTRRHAKAPTPLVVGDLTIDMARHSAIRAGREITLTAKEFSLLSYLAQNAGRVVSRAELLQNVWDDSRNSYSNIIDVYAARLRRKIDEGAKVPLFVTVRGAGFMLEAPAKSLKHDGKKHPARGRS